LALRPASAFLPSTNHEILVQILRETPKLVPELLRIAFGIDLYGTTELLSSAETLTDLHPAEYRADAVLVVRNSSGAAVEAFVVEVQLSPDRRKRYAWPIYVSGIRARLRCPVTLVAVAPDPKVARWCAQPIDLGRGRAVMSVAVIGPAEVPRVTDPTVAQALPELALLSVLAHRGDSDAVSLARVALASFGVGAIDLDDDRAALYADVVFASLSEAARRALEAEMRIEGYEYQSEFARRYFSEGKAAGQAEGKAEGRIESLLTILDARGLSVSDAHREQILACSDEAQLDVWLRRALTIDRVDALFE
jgi:hypothetical protein